MHRRRLRATAATSPSRSCVAASATTPARRRARPRSSAARSRRRGRCRRARRTPAPPTRRRARRGRPRGGSGRAAASGRAARSRRRARRSSTRRAPSAAAKSTRPGGRGNSSSRPSWVETRGTKSGSMPALRERLRRARPDRGDPRRLPPRRRASWSRAVRARDDHPVVAARSTGVVAERLDLDQRALDDLAPERLEPRDERPGLRARPRRRPHARRHGATRPARRAPFGGRDVPYRNARASPHVSVHGFVPTRPPRARARARPRHRVVAVGARPSAVLAAISAVSIVPSWCAATGARHPPPIAATHARSASTRRRVSGSSARGDALLLARAHLQRERALAGLGQQLLRVEAMPDLARRARAGRARTRRGRSRRALARRACAGACRCSRAAARSTSVGSSASSCARRRTDAVPTRIPGRELGSAAERVARILTRQVRADGEPVGVRRGHVLRGVHRDVDAPVEQRLLELLHEHAARADLAERPRAVAVAGGRDRDERDLDAGPPQKRVRGELGLGEREPTAARPDADEHTRRRPDALPHSRPRGRMRTNAVGA